ncbi:MAG: carboxypeptidase-like regulatory domain-containing protein [Chitinophagaceae bacterium]|nr:carboxypeptidase-like regulatory domain-containing protein [Chitinophagaceae bacterium]
MKKILISLFCILLVAGVSAQDKTFIVIGKVIDSASRLPLAGASAFCPNTTYGSVSNAEGMFMLKLPSGGYDLVVSYTGYDKKLFRISDNQNNSDTLIVDLPQQDKTMAEVSVVASNEVPDGLAKYGEFFISNFIGTSPNAAYCKVMNPETLRFFYNKKRNRLKVTAREDVLIHNYALGYTIRYQLDSFNYDYNSNISQYTGFPLFTEMDTTVEARTQFIKNRARTYLGSRLHFMRSFYNSNVVDEGFIVEDLSQGASKAKIIGDLYDTEQYALDSGEVLIGWKGKYRINYKSVFPDKKFLEEFKLPSNSRYQVTILDIADGFVIERNGYFYEQYDVVNSGYWAWKKVAEILPYDYVYQ